MQYTLITPNGRKMNFYVKEVAELYKRIKGGVVIEVEISVDSPAVLAV